MAPTPKRFWWWLRWHWRWHHHRFVEVGDGPFLAGQPTRLWRCRCNAERKVTAALRSERTEGV